MDNTNTNTNNKTIDILNICVTGAAGQIAYSFIPILASGDVFGPNTKVNLSLLDIPPTLQILESLNMELEDCAFPLLQKISYHTDPQKAFVDCDVVIFLGGFPRKAGMERKDLLSINAKIFQEQGRALDIFAKKTVKCLVVANPANTNCLILHKNAPSIPKNNFSALSRLDLNRAKAQIANYSGNIGISDVKNIIIWGNHSSTMYPDVNHGTIKNTPIREAIADDNYLNNEFIKKVQNRGAEIISKKKTSSVFSAAHAVKDHMKDWYNGKQGDGYMSMGVVSKGEYGVPEGIVFSYPVVFKGRFEYEVVDNLSLDDFSKSKIKHTLDELLSEMEDAKEFI